MKRAAAVVTDRGGRLFDERNEAVTRTIAQGASEPAREATQAPAAQATGTASEAVASRTTR
jgi:hypothetical protein